MSIPLDRLYHYLDNLCSDNVIIYRWCPHGSKKLEDIRLHRTYSFDPSEKIKIQEYAKVHCTPNMICHDQEPLQYDHYSESEFFNLYCNNSIFKDTIINFDEYAPEISKLHLRTKMIPNNVYDYALICHSEKNSDQLTLYENNYFIGVYYWAHALIARDWFRFAEHDTALSVNFDNIDHDFLVYNRAWLGTREYRLKFSELIVDHKLAQACNIKFNPIDDGHHYVDHDFKNKKFQINNKQIELTLRENSSQSWASADYDHIDYKKSAIEVVLETLFDDTRNHLTEKTLRPIACGRPFILTSTPGSLAYLRDYGFKTFHGLINESYDNIADPLERLEAIVFEMQRISDLSKTEKRRLWTNLYEIAEYNKQRFFSDEFQQFVTDEFVVNLNAALDKCHQHMGKWWSYFNSFEQRKEYEAKALIDQWLDNHTKSR